MEWVGGGMKSEDDSVSCSLEHRRTSSSRKGAWPWRLDDQDFDGERERETQTWRVNK